MTITTDVLIVGAGPSGLTLATMLAAAGIQFQIIDSDPGPTTQSRATLIHVRTLELWDKLGVVAPLLQHGVPITGVILLAFGKPTGCVPIHSPEAEPTLYPFALSLPQSTTEHHLVAQLAQRGCHVQWNTQLIGFTHTDSSVDAVLQSSATGLHSVQAQYLVEADGAKSLVRRILNLQYPGGTYDTVAFLADVTLETPYEPNTLNINLAQTGFVGILALGDDRYRLFGALPPRYARTFEVAQQEGRPIPLPDLQAWFTEYYRLPNRIMGVSWSSIYKIHHRLADHYRAERCFLLGDTAHIHSPTGGQGLNLGVGDAVNLGWKLAHVLRGEARAEVLDTYEGERRPVAQAILRGTDYGFKLFDGVKNGLVNQVRITVAPRIMRLIGKLPRGRKMIFRLLTQTWIHYRASPLEAKPAMATYGPQPGDRAPYAVFTGQVHEGTGLYAQLRGVHHDLLIFDGTRPADEVARHAAAYQAILSTFSMVVNLHRIPSEEQHLHTRYAAQHGKVVFIRPDGYIAYMGGLTDGQRFHNFLAQWYIPRQTASEHQINPRVASEGTSA